MIDKIKSKAMNYWTHNKIECVVFAVLIAALILK
tara:strand:+ start:389 stop:490 length:102 start_codon:yes stop_codon:yes gene_type:complete